MCEDGSCIGILYDPDKTSGLVSDKNTVRFWTLGVPDATENVSCPPPTAHELCTKFFR